MSKSKKQKVSLYNRCLNGIERVGNKLPHPVILFAIFALAVVVISAICKACGVSVTGEMISKDPATQEYIKGIQTVKAESLLTKEGLAFMFTTAVKNFTNYAPLGMVLVAMLGVGVAEQSGMINTLLKRAVKSTPKFLLTPMIVFLGVMSNIASDAGYVILIPLGAMMFRACGRHPIAGLAAAFAGVSGGFSANLLIGTLDPLLAGITQTAVTAINPNYTVQVMGNYVFMAVSTFLITILGTIITNKVIEPRLGKYVDDGDVMEDASLMEISAVEKKGLRAAGISALIFIAVIVGCCIPQNSFFRNDAGELLGNTPLMDSIVVLIALLFFIPGAVYGRVTKSFENSSGVANAMSKAMAGMGSFLALAFVSAQFIEYFNYTKLGTIIALSGAELLESAKIGLIPLVIIFVLFAAFMNLFMGSASAKWAIMAPVFVPMFMALGYSPELCQLAYRVGDSCTNIITPLMTYYAVIIVFAQRYDKKAGIGTLTATMLPYSICFLLAWSLMLVIWLLVGLPIGINTPIILG